MIKDSNSFMIFVTAFFIALIFASWSFLPILFGQSTEAFFVSSSSSFFQSLQSWQPLIGAIDDKNLFPSAPNVNSDKAFLFYPYITLWFFGFIKLVCGQFCELFLNQIVIPTLCFILLAKIFLRYLSLRWSIAISLLSVISFSETPFRQFLFELISLKNLSEIATIQPPEILHFPFPSFSLLIFLAIYYFCTKQKKLTSIYISGFTILWSLTTQIHVIDAFFGLIFWFAYFPIKLFRQEKAVSFQILIRQIIIQFIIALTIISPSLFALAKATEADLGFVVKDIDFVGLYYYFSYFFVPIFGCLLMYFIFRVDIYEILLKFWHIYILMFAEIFLLSAAKIFDIGIDLEMVINRVPLFFLHFYYYVPIIYFASRPLNHNFKHGIESKKFFTIARNFIIWFFGNFSKFYLPLLSILLMVFALNSSFYYFKYYQSLKEIVDLKIENFKVIDQKLGSQKNNVIIFSDPVITSIASTKSYKTLWPNRFSNNVSQEEIISKIALNAKIFNWSEDEFIKFMLPGKLQNNNAEIINLANNLFDSGIGYWLVFHKKVLVQDKEYYEMLQNIYRNIDVESLIKKYKVSYIVFDQNYEFSKAKKIEKIKEISFYKIYE